MPRVGEDIESICGKCGDVWHVVVAMVGDRIAKVLCKQCGGQHRYRPPGGAQPARRAATRIATSARSVGRAGGKGRGAKPVTAEPLIEPDLSVPVRPYRLGDSFAVGHRIAHPKFGPGIVETIVGRGKIQVWFADGRRVLAHEQQ